MAGRKIRDEADARACLAAAEASGLTRAEWGQQNGLDGRSLTAWQLNLARRKDLRAMAPRESGGAQEAMATREAVAPPEVMEPQAAIDVPVRLVELVPAPPSAPSPARYVVRCGGLAVEVDERFDDATLHRLLQVVIAC